MKSTKGSFSRDLASIKLDRASAHILNHKNGFVPAADDIRSNRSPRHVSITSYCILYSTNKPTREDAFASLLLWAKPNALRQRVRGTDWARANNGFGHAYLMHIKLMGNIASCSPLTLNT